MRYTLARVLLLLININSIAQQTTEWFPAKLNIQPFTAHFLEPKAGFQYLFELEKVRIDIGTSHDLIHWLNESESFSFGADFLTYTRARSENNFKFPVETVDYLFGVNGGYKSKSEKCEWGMRLRFSHISAHLVDGYSNDESESWLSGREPFVYSREFFELIAYYNRGARAFIDHMQDIDPDLLRKILVIDFNLEVLKELKDKNIKGVFGDISSMDTLEHAHISSASIILVTIPDSLLKGTNNLALVSTCRTVAPNAVIVATADSVEKIEALKASGANEVLLPYTLIGDHLARYVDETYRNLVGEEEPRQGEATPG